MLTSLLLRTIPIKKQTLPVCLKRVHFTPTHFDNTQFGRCGKFIDRNLVTGEYKPHLALTCRMMEHKCGALGAEYTEKSGDPLGCINNYHVNASLHETYPKTNLTNHNPEDLLLFEPYPEANDVGKKKK